MAITYQNVQIQGLTKGSTTVDTATYQNTLVYSRSGSVLINAGFTKQVSSVAPPPYDENGYNYDTAAPNVIETVNIDLGDISSYDYLTFDWNNDDSYNFFGWVEAKVVIGDNVITQTIFDSANPTSGTKKIDISELSGEYVAHFTVRAQSRSPYMYYGTRTTLTVSNICGVYGEVVPSEDLGNFALGPIASSAPPPYRGTEQSDWYNIYGDNGAPAYETHTIRMGDVTQYSALTFDWTNTGTEPEEATGSGFGSRVMAKYHNPATDTDVSIFDHVAYSGTESGTVTIDISSLTGSQSVIVTIGAISGNDYAPYGARTYLAVSDITLS